MAQKTVVTTPDVAANSGQGTPLATAFEWINDNFDEVYAKPDLTLAANILTLTKPDGTTDTVDLSSYLDEDARAIASGTINGSGIVTFTRDDATTFTLDLSSLLDDTNLARITSGSVAGSTLTLTRNDATTIDIDVSSLLDDTTANDATITLTAGSGLTGGGSFTTDQASADTVTFDVNVDDSTIEVATDTVQVKDLGIATGKIANNAVTHDKLEDRYTVEVTKTDTSGTGGSAVTLNWSAGAIFHFSNSLTGAIELKFDQYKANQVIDIYGLTGSQTVTLNSTASGTEVFKRIGTQEYDGTADNHIQVICLDDSASTPVFHYAIGTTTSTATA